MNMMPKILSRVFMIGIAISVLSLPCAADPPGTVLNKNADVLKIIRITPTGADVPAERQIVFKFNMPVVPVGRMERTPAEVPITIKPDLEGQWRWLDTSTLALQLGDKERLKPATRYNIRVEPKFVSPSGKAMQDAVIQSFFITIRPRIEYVNFNNWKGPGHPIIGLSFNQQVQEQSVISHLQFLIKDKITVPVVLAEKATSTYGSAINIAPAQELPIDTEINLVVTPGIVSQEGPETGVESRPVVVFHTFPEFRFLGIRGWDINGQEITLAPGSSEELRFQPLKGLRLLFSTPVPARAEGPKLRFTPDLAGGRTDYDPWADTSEGEYFLRQPHKLGAEYPVTVPEALKAFQDYRLTGAPDFQDIFGRTLARPLKFAFKTSHRPPELFVKNEISVLEKNEKTHLPLVITNLNRIQAKYRLLNNPTDYWTLHDLAQCYGTFHPDKEHVIKTEPVQDVSYAFPLKVRDILGGRSGALAGILEPEPDVHPDCTFRFFSQVTNLAVHVKLGHHNTTVWVTRMDTGEPVANAQVDLFLHEQSTPATGAKTDSKGLAQLKGTVEIDPWIENLKGNLQKTYGVVRVLSGDESAILPLISQFSDNEYDYYEYEEEGPADNHVQYSHMQAWGTTSQGVYKPGDTVSYKLYVRDQSNRRFIQPKLSSYNLKVIDPTGNVAYEQDNLALSEFGALDGSFEVAKGAVTGWYRFQLTPDFSQNVVLHPLQVLVTDFTPAPFKVQTDLKGQLFKIGSRVEIETGARLHSGGPYGKAEARITALLQPSYFQPAQPPLDQFRFMDYNYDYGKRPIFQEEQVLDDKGDLSSSFTLEDSGVVCGTLTVESAVRDDRGKYIASSASAKFMGRDRLVGLYQPQWLLKEDEEAEFQVMAVDEKEQPVSDTKIQALVEYDRVTGTRVKGAGNAYLIQYQHTREKVKEFDLQSQLKPLICKFTPQEPGTYFISARVKDTAGREHSVNMEKYCAGKGRILWEMPEDNSLTIIPAQQEYKVGQHARFMIKNPYPGAQALITIERLGVMKKWTEVFSDNTPVVEFDVEPDFVPGFYLSVLVHAPRVDKPIDENNVDLGKPTCRIGYLTVTVNDPYKRLNVQAKTDKQIYSPRDKAFLELDVTDIQKKAPEAEVAVAVVDEAVLDLVQGGPDYYDPYKGFYHLGPLDMRNYNLLFRLIGRQRFEKKGANAGGSGGEADFKMRNLFKFVTYWNPKILPDKNGHVKVSFDLPDNLTGWRVLALAVTKNDLMGLGQTHFVTNKFTEIRPALPNQVTEGDSFEAIFTVMNRSDKERRLDVEIKAEGPGVEATPVKMQITAKPYVRNKVGLPVKTKQYGEVILMVRAGDGLDQDGLKLSLKVNKKQAVEAAATYGTTIDKQVTELFEFPRNMRNDTGRVSVVVAPAIISALEGAFRYMRDYPYFCWEQRLSKGVMAMHYLNLKPYLAKSLEWNEAQEVVARMLADAGSFQAPNGGMCYYIPADAYACPYLSAYTALAFNWLKESGYKPEPKVEQALHGYLQELLKRDVFPSFFSKGMTSTVRAVALAALAQNGEVTKADLERYLPHVEYMDLFGQAHYLQAAVFVNDTTEIQAQTYDRIMAHANETGGKVIFTDPIYGQDICGGYGRILSSEMRTNAAVLSAILAREEGALKFSGANKTAQPARTFSTDTAFKVVRYLTQTRKSRDHWENTQENVFCLQALTAFSRIYDKEIPKYTVTGSMDGKEFGKTSFQDFRDPAVELERPVAKNDPGRKTQVVLNKEGPGRLYYAARLFYSPAQLKLDPINSGIEVHREYYVEKDKRWVLLTNPMTIKQGDLVRVDLFISLPSARNFVVVADPVPGGLEPVNRDLATSSQVDADKEAGTYSGGSWWFKFGDWHAYGYSRWSFYHQEVLHHSVRFYSDYLSAGNYHLSYIAQAIAPGEFYVMPLHAEEMYDPDVFGQGVPEELKIKKSEE
jgi:hypothetical protein